ncbi:HILPDA domain containing protein isoform 2 [Scophthalmus maximus]|nr:HILPDA domain containing protein [Scophthalmus maximus]AWO98116.1 HILPDA domain containing protein isoform 2 [Scophthalmus maximus]
MVPAILKVYLIGTVLTVLAVFYGIVDSFGGLMYAQDHNYMLERDEQTQRQLSTRNRQRGSHVTKGIGS